MHYGISVFLQVPVQTLAKRVTKNGHASRPLLNGGDATDDNAETKVLHLPLLFLGAFTSCRKPCRPCLAAGRGSRRLDPLFLAEIRYIVGNFVLLNDFSVPGNSRIVLRLSSHAGVHKAVNHLEGQKRILRKCGRNGLNSRCVVLYPASRYFAS